MRLRRLRGEQGFTMVAVLGAVTLTSVLAAGALAAANGDLGLTQRDLYDKRAYAAAQAGIADYSFHLNNDNNYWSRCTSVPTPNAINQQGSTANRRAVGGSSDASYAIELLPAVGQSSCNPANPAATMLEQTGPNAGTFRIRATGYAGETQQSIVASFKRASLLDYIYFTQLETSDPVTYNNAATIAGAYQQCTKFIREGRYNQPIPNSSPTQNCDRISFVTADQIKGPLHTNDALQICGNPTFGRSPADVIEVSSPPQGWSITPGCPGSSQPNFVGPFVTTAPVLTPPPTNGSLRTIPGTPTYTGQTSITLSGSQYRVNGGPLLAIPSSGVIYVRNGSCSSSYSPFTATYPSSSGCGNVLLSGNYSGQLTIAGENDIIVEGDVTRTGAGMLGLIANNFVRVKHAYPSQTSRTNCGDGSGAGPVGNRRIDAAILAINHSFIVDHYNCGSPLGTLTVNGAISQKFRGAVGTASGGSIVTGFGKNYTYDDRLRYQEPPNFLDPVESAWHVQRQTLDYP